MILVKNVKIILTSLATFLTNAPRESKQSVVPEYSAATFSFQLEQMIRA